MRWGWIFLVAVLCAGCTPRDREIRLQRLEVQRRGLVLQLDELEDRMVATQARVRFWREMRDRHQSVTAIACQSLQGHADSMALLARRQGERRVAMARPRRVAARWPGGD